MKKYFILSCVNLFIFIPVAVKAQISEKDSLALVDLYYSLNGDSWNKQTYGKNWLSDNRVSSWYGITVSNERVIKIDFKSAPTNFTGTIPSSIGNLSALQHLILRGNRNITGNIPSEVGNLTSLTYLDFSNNGLSGTIPDEIWNLVSLTTLNLGGNKLNGSISPSIGNLSNLQALYLSQNEFEGSIPAEIGNLKSLIYFWLFDNMFDELPNLPASVDVLAIQSNNFDFDDLEPFASRSFSDFRYSPQADIYMTANETDGAAELSMNAGGTGTIFKWYFNNELISGATSSSFNVPFGNDIQKYRCEANNNLLPNLTIKGIPPKVKVIECWENGMLKFCANSGAWEKGDDENEIKSTNIISINDFLFFNGTISIDTFALSIAANGEFYVDNIPIPGGGIGKYTILEGEHNLQLIGNEGRIMDFLNSNLSNTASLFGAELKIDELQFFSRVDTIGFKIGCSAQIPWVSESCGIGNLFSPNGVSLKLKNLEVTNKGIMSAGFEAENIGLFKEGHCLNKISYEYNWKNNVLIAGADVNLPFIKVGLGGGFKLENGVIDSVAWRAEYLPPDDDGNGGNDPVNVNPKAIPVGFYTLGVKGFSGHISGLNQPGEFSPQNMSFELGGVFSDITWENWYRVEGKGHTIWPKVFNIKGDGQFLKPPIEGIPYQIRGVTDMSYNVSENNIYMGFRGTCGTLDEKEWLIDGVGNLNVTMYEEEPLSFTGNIEGLLTLPKLQNNWFFRWLNLIFDLPVVMHTDNRFNDRYLTKIHGKASLKTANLDTISVKYILDVGKQWYQSGYFEVLDYGYNVKSVRAKENGNSGNDLTKKFNVPENNSFGVIEIKSNGSISKSSIISPANKKYSESSIEDNILYTEANDEKEAFWTMVGASPGEWTIVIEDSKQGDSIFTYFQLKDPEFIFSMNQENNVITINWDITQVEPGQTLNVMLDEDNEDFDGFKVVDIDATTGSVSFTLDENTPACSYFLYVQLFDENSFIEVYSKEIIQNPATTLIPPENFNFHHNKETGYFDFTWSESPSSEIAGYILTITDEFDNDSVYAVLNSSQTSISLNIENYEKKTAKLECYNRNWKIGCPYILPSLITGFENIDIDHEIKQKLKVYPNPTEGKCNIVFTVSKETNCEIRVFDMNGNTVFIPYHGIINAGHHLVTFNYNELSNGVYFIKFISDSESYTIKSVLSK